jgi:hypothetical protein
MLLLPDRSTYVLIHLLLAVIVSSVSAQGKDTQSVPVEDSLAGRITDSLSLGSIDPADTVQTSFWPALIRSAIIPGWGQIEQEHPGRAVIFYGLSLSSAYNFVYHYQWYHKTNDETNKVKMQRFGIAYLSLYALNLADIIISHETGDDKPWPQNLYSDTPLKSPWGAVARSAMLPGWGQCYNESYIKAVLAFGTSLYFASKIVTYEMKYRETGEIGYRDQRITNSWYFGFAYFIIMVDTYIDAYLYKFDEAIKLTYNYLPVDNSFSLGVHIVF